MQIARTLLGLLVFTIGLSSLGEAEGAMILTLFYRDTGGETSDVFSNALGQYDAFGSSSNAFAEQHSLASTSSFSGTMSAFRDMVSGSEAYTILGAEFDLATPHAFSFTGNSTDGGTNAISGGVQLVAVTGSISPQAVGSLSAFGNSSLSETGILGPGSYVFVASLAFDPEDTDLDSGTVDFEFVVTAIVPEPGSMALCSVGAAALMLFGIVGYCRRERDAMLVARVNSTGSRAVRRTGHS